ncbi:hypothetical protein AGMMS4952_06040 [Spirochaetia bacterium]|nr:hypothetical protein AGMMS4952_06040 [Spirochaetia bacterium]
MSGSRKGGGDKVTPHKIIVSLKTKARDLAHNLSALSLAYKRKDVSIFAKGFILLAVGYALSPIDLIPDFIPILGYLDDLIILPVLIFIAIKLIPREILEECKAEAKGLWQNGKPKKWYYAIPIALVWIFALGIVVLKIIFRV